MRFWLTGSVCYLVLLYPFLVASRNIQCRGPADTEGPRRPSPIPSTSMFAFLPIKTAKSQTTSSRAARALKPALSRTGDLRLRGPVRAWQTWRMASGPSTNQRRANIARQGIATVATVPCMCRRCHRATRSCCPPHAFGSQPFTAVRVAPRTLPAPSLVG